MSNIRRYGVLNIVPPDYESVPCAVVVAVLKPSTGSFIFSLQKNIKITITFSFLNTFAPFSHKFSEKKSIFRIYVDIHYQSSSFQDIPWEIPMNKFDDCLGLQNILRVQVLVIF